MALSTELQALLKGLPGPSQAALAARAGWLAKARPDQLTPEGEWPLWLCLAGRGWGKTRTGAEDVAWYGARRPNSRIAVVAPTYADARDTCIEGESGLLSVIPPECINAWNRSLGELILWNGTRYKLFAAEEPDRLRGPQHHRAWADEVAAWRYPETWDQLQFGLRLGDRPQIVATTTPRANALTRQLMHAAGARITRGSTYDNAANLPAATIAQLRERYEGTRLGRQELHAEVLDDVPGALWSRAMIDGARVSAAPQLARIVVAVDPSGNSGGDDEADDIGIVVAGRGMDGRGYVLADWTCDLSPAGWGRRVIEAFDNFRADKIVAERNFGGAMVESVIKATRKTAPVKLVTASRGKVQRAEPIAALYEQGRISHIGVLAELEDQLMCFTGDGYVGNGSPDRADALVWALTELMIEGRGSVFDNL